MTPRLLLGLASLVAGLVLALALPDLRVFWFEGRALGIALAVLGGLDVADALCRREGGAG